MTSLSRRLIGAALFAAIWVLVAGLRPDATFHLAPLIVAAWPALGERDLSRAASMSALGLLLALATTTLLFYLGWLAGPSLLPSGGAGVESVLVGGAGALLGILLVALSRLTATRASSG